MNSAPPLRGRLFYFEEEIAMKTVKVKHPFVYYINGYERAAIEPGKCSLPDGCADYATAAGLAEPVKGPAKEREGGEGNDGAVEPGGGEKTLEG
jgi:hypothetical protein